MSPNKTRINIMLDNDVISHFRNLADESSRGYQTIINEALRTAASLKEVAQMTTLEKSMTKMIEETTKHAKAIERQLDSSGVKALVAQMTAQQEQLQKTIEAQTGALAAAMKSVEGMVVQQPDVGVASMMEVANAMALHSQEAIRAMQSPLDELHKAEQKFKDSLGF